MVFRWTRHTTNDKLIFGSQNKLIHKELNQINENTQQNQWKTNGQTMKTTVLQTKHMISLEKQRFHKKHNKTNGKTIKPIQNIETLQNQ